MRYFDLPTTGFRLITNMARSAFALAALIAACAYAPAAAASDAIGHVKTVSGAASVLRGDFTTPLAAGDPVYRKDELITGEDGTLGVTFKDGSRISLGPSGRLSLKAFEFEPAEEKLSFVSRLAYGTLHFVSGIMSKLSPDAVSVETPVATLAVRGTNFAIRIPKTDE